MSLSVSHNTKIYLQLGSTDMRNGVNGLSSLIIDAIAKDANASSLFVFRGRRADKIKILYWDGQGFCLFYKRLERGKFVWPKSENGGPIMITTAQLSMLLGGATGGVCSGQRLQKWQDKLLIFIAFRWFICLFFMVVYAIK